MAGTISLGQHRPPPAPPGSTDPGLRLPPLSGQAGDHLKGCYGRLAASAREELGRLCWPRAGMDTYQHALHVASSLEGLGRKRPHETPPQTPPPEWLPASSPGCQILTQCPGVL